ncbi:MAG: hypothetical protein B9S32_05830 [Verrucomicrobia bacterium Tous-C9LFEB]|nr:MAG: hypothetical protein B9S32_05830 [Verrucomicrobia bacterium Tous-C9LFEB]
MNNTIKVVLLALVLWTSSAMWGGCVDLVWLSPAGPAVSTDYYSLFNTANDSQWTNARSKVNVYKLYLGTVQNSTDAQLTALFSYLNAKGIALALEWPPLYKDGLALEGFGVKDLALSVGAKIKRNGGALKYVAMDEPLYYGCVSNSGPKWDVVTMANNAAISLKQLQSSFSGLIIGDIEPIDAMPAATWQSLTSQWLAAYQVAMGQPLEFFHVDCLWGTVWTTNIPALNNLLAGSNAKLGVIFNSLAVVTTNSAWMQSAEVNIQRYNASGIVKPTHIVFQNWMTYPTVLLPESSPTAYTYLINYYYGAYATQTPPQGFNRMVKGGLHFYTANTTEVSQFVAAGWATEGTSGRVYAGTAGAPSLSALYRLYKVNGTTKRYFYTANATERTNSINLYGYVDDGIAGYVFTSSNSGGVALYRAYSATYGHFYTTSQTEYNGLSASTWTKDGISCYMP